MSTTLPGMICEEGGVDWAATPPPILPSVKQKMQRMKKIVNVFAERKAKTLAVSHY